MMKIRSLGVGAMSTLNYSPVQRNLSNVPTHNLLNFRARWTGTKILNEHILNKWTQNKDIIIILKYTKSYV